MSTAGWVVIGVVVGLAVVFVGLAAWAMWAGDEESKGYPHARKGGRR